MKKIIFVLSLFFSAALFGQVDRTEAPKAQQNPEIKIDMPQDLHMENGLRVIIVENHKLPKVSFQLFVDYPNPLEGDKAGVSSIFGEMLGSGTKTTPKAEFDEKIDYMGATFSSNARGFYASSLKKHTPELLQLLNELIMEPAFAQEDFDRILSQNISGLASLASDPSGMSSNVASVVNYGVNHPYGEVMTEETLGNISLDDVKDYYKTNFIPNHAYLVVVGDVNFKEVKEYVYNYFVPWKSKEYLKRVDYVTPRNSGKNVYFVNKPGAVQSVIKITHTVDLKPGHEDEIKLKLLNQILGGGSFSARLMSNLREDKAYTYGCYSTISSDELKGNFSAGGSFRNEVTDSAIVQILEEIKRIANEPVTDKELDLVKKSMTGAFARSLESPQTVARFALNMFRFNLPQDYYSTYLTKLERITKEDLLLVADKYLQPYNINIVVVGNDEIAEKLNDFDVDGKVDFKNQYGEDEEMLKAVPEGVTVESIINSYAMAVLMAESKEAYDSKLKSVQQIEIYRLAEIKDYGAKIYRYGAMGAPNKSGSMMYVSSAMGGQVAQTEWFNGETGQGVDDNGQPKEYTGDDLQDKKRTSFPVNQMAYLNDEKVQTTLMGIATYNDRPHYKVKVVEGDEISFEYYDTESGLLSKVEGIVMDENGEPTETLVTFEDYVQREGVMVASKQVINAQGQVLEFNLIRVVTSNKAKAKIFSGKTKKVQKALVALSLGK
ncbi:MAG: M16 family metallopeptidase [Crocinitomicaceae bacterium]